MDKPITAGEFAKLASTTKRTILFYDHKGILKPAKIKSNGYRYYEEKQILEYQMILLLTTLGVSINDISRHLNKKGSPQSLFLEKKQLIKEQIKKLQFNLNNVEKFMENLKKNSTMVDPQIKTMPPFGVYFIDKIGSYAKIGDYCYELIQMLKSNDNTFTTLAIFEDATYQPKKSRIKIGVLAKKGIKVKEQFKEKVKFMEFKPGKVITYTHNGSGSLLSLFWKELEKYCKLKGLKVRHSTPDFEIYRKVDADETKQFFEIYLPIQ